jgi:NAD+ synthase/NAD+ synthase (glutamine-hydrolysing)
MRIALAQLDTTLGDFEGNRERILDALRHAEDEDADLLLVPELAICGYPPKDLLDRPAFHRGASRVLSELTKRVKGTALLVGTFLPNPRPTGKPYYNVAALLKNGRIAAVAKKCLLPTYDVFDEARHFEPGRTPLIVPFKGERLGLTICEDLWNDKDFWRARRVYREDPGEELVRRGATFIVNISASPFSEGKPRVRRRMLQRLAKDGRVPIAYLNLVGGNDDLVFDGSSIVIDDKGRVKARAALFAEDFLVVDVGKRGTFPRPIVPVLGADEEDLVDDAEDEPLESLRRALVLGLSDYAKKCGFTTAVLGLSGGIDSALVAVLAVQALGRENVTALAMPSRYSSPGSVADARGLAENLGIRFQVVPIDGMFSSALDATRPLFCGRPEDITEENLQSRLRGLVLMAFSNKFGPLVLTTGNKSELAVGYCTLYGDMCGGLAPISDLPKMKVYALAKHLNARAGRPLIPEATFTKAPSAELKPDQTDQDTLPPYPVLDAVLERLVERNLSAEATAKEVAAPLALVEKIARQLDRAEYKRSQAAPGLKVSMKAFGTGRRIPIAQRSPT